MRPIRLSFEGLTCYATRQTLDFEKLNLDLFAITGPKGAGKSSILDAICLVLYDKSSRGLNPIYRIRPGCNQLKIELEFGVDGEWYQVQRVWVRKKDGVFNKLSVLRYFNLEMTDNAALGVHFHNDLGMALENTLQAVMAGVSMISGTFLGIGERAGNIPLEQVLNGLRLRFGIEVEGINYQALSQVTNYLDSLGVRPAPPYSQVALRHESGIHVNGFLRDPDSYHIFSHAEPEIWFGKCSGASNFQYLFEKQLNQPLSPQEYNRMRDKIKSFSIQEQRCFSPEEIVSLFKQGFFND